MDNGRHMFRTEDGARRRTIMAYIKLKVMDTGLTRLQKMELERSLDMVLSRMRQDYGITTILDMSESEPAREELNPRPPLMRRSVA